MEWKRRSVVDLKQKLARSLLDCQEFEAAIKVDPTCAGKEEWYIVKACIYIYAHTFLIYSSRRYQLVKSSVDFICRSSRVHPDRQDDGTQESAH